MPVSLKRLKFIAAQWCRDDPRVKTWELLNEEQRVRLLNLFPLQPGEIPLVTLLEAPSPLMISNHRLCWVTGAQAIELDLNQVTAIRPPDKKFDKLRLHTLIIKTNKSRQYSLELPPGSTCFTIWNLVLRFMRRGLGKSSS